MGEKGRKGRGEAISVCVVTARSAIVYCRKKKMLVCCLCMFGDVMNMRG
jgi:hypothetical protein